MHDGDELSTGSGRVQSRSATPYYDADGITLFLGDCREVTEWLAADVLVTDPPYGVAWKSGQMSNALVPVEDEIEGDADTAARDAVLAA